MKDNTCRFGRSQGCEAYLFHFKDMFPPELERD